MLNDITQKHQFFSKKVEGQRVNSKFAVLITAQQAAKFSWMGDDFPSLKTFNNNWGLSQWAITSTQQNLL